MRFKRYTNVSLLEKTVFYKIGFYVFGLQVGGSPLDFPIKLAFRCLEAVLLMAALNLNVSLPLTLLGLLRTKKRTKGQEER